MQNVNFYGVNFQGPFSLATTSFNPVAGVYLITDARGNVLDVGETGDLKTRIACHEREACWNRNYGVSLWFYSEVRQWARLQVEKAIRVGVNPVCGVR